jgi:hypothetical protein
LRPPGEAVGQASPDRAPAVWVLYSEGCPEGEASPEVLREVLSETAPGTGVEMAELSSRTFFELGTPGSPTILVNGRDLCPPGDSPSAATSCCGLYATPDGPRSHPTVEMVRDVLREHGVVSVAVL